MPILFITKIVTFILGFFSTLYVVKLLSVDDFGLYSTILMSIPFINQFTSLCNYEYLIRNLININSSKKDAEYLFSTMFITLIINMIISCVISIILKEISFFVFVYFIMLSLFEYIQRYYMAKSNVQGIAINDFLLNGFWIVLFFILNESHIGLSVFNIIFLSRIAVLFLSILYFSKKNIDLIKNIKISFDIILESYKYGIPIVIGAMAFTFLMGAERIFLTVYSDSNQAGLYSFIQIPFNVIFSLFSGTILVTSIRHIRVNKSLHSNEVLNNVLDIVTILFLPILLLISVNFNIFEYIIGNNKYDINEKYTIFISLSCFFLMINTILKQDLILDGKGLCVTKIVIITLSINILLSYVFYSIYGYTAAIIVNFITNFVNFIFIFYNSSVLFDYFKRLFYLIVLVLIINKSIMLLTSMLFSNNRIMLIISSIIGFVLTIYISKKTSLFDIYKVFLLKSNYK